jgi:hypothetical protein
MSIAMTKQIWSNADPELSGGKLLVMLCLADHANEVGECWPSTLTIAREVRLHRQNVMVHIKELEASGYITVKRVLGVHNTYVVHPTCNATVTGNASTTCNASITPPVTLPLHLPVTPALHKPPLNHKENRKDITSPEPPAKRHPNQVYVIAATLAEVCKMDLQANKGRLLKEAGLLIKASPPATSELIRQYYNGGGWWWTYDWRGMKNQLPQPSTIRATWGQWQDVLSDTVDNEDDYKNDPQMAYKRSLREGNQ